MQLQRSRRLLRSRDGRMQSQYTSNELFWLCKTAFGSGSELIDGDLQTVLPTVGKVRFTRRAMLFLERWWMLSQHEVEQRINLPTARKTVTVDPCGLIRILQFDCFLDMWASHGRSKMWPLRRRLLRRSYKRDPRRLQKMRMPAHRWSK